MNLALRWVSARLLAITMLATGIVALGNTVAAAQDSGATLQDITLRDQLIAAQESLLNVYRCRFDIDTQLVPGGCAEQPVQKPVEEPDPEQIDVHVFYCVPANAGYTQAKLQAEAGRFNGDIRNFFLRESSNTVKCWGFDDDERGNQIGLASPPVGRFTAITAGHPHTCGLRPTGSVQCWGSNSDIWHNTYVGQSNAPGGTFAAVSAGTWHSCALRDDGTITCWGSNQDFDGTVIGQLDGIPEGSFTAISAGDYHSCALREDGSVRCWGSQYASV